MKHFIYLFIYLFISCSPKKSENTSPPAQSLSSSLTSLMDISSNDITVENLTDKIKSKPIYQAMQDDLYFVMMLVKNVATAAENILGSNKNEATLAQKQQIKQAISTKDLAVISTMHNDLKNFTGKYDKVSSLLSQETAISLALENFHTFMKSSRFNELLSSLEDLNNMSKNIKSTSEDDDSSKDDSYTLKIKEIANKMFNSLDNNHKAEIQKFFSESFQVMINTIPMLQTLNEI